MHERDLAVHGSRQRSDGRRAHEGRRVDTAARTTIVMITRLLLVLGLLRAVVGLFCGGSALLQQSVC